MIKTVLLKKLFFCFFLMLLFIILFGVHSNTGKVLATSASCGSLHQVSFVYAVEDWPSNDFCSVGFSIPSNPNYPSGGSSTTWDCKNVREYEVEIEVEEEVEVECPPSEEEENGEEEVCTEIITRTEIVTEYEITFDYCWASRMPGPDSDEWWNDNCGNLNGTCGSLHRTVFPHDQTSWPSGGSFCGTGNQVIVPSNPQFPSIGRIRNWKCAMGSKLERGFYVNCWAARSSRPPACGSLHEETFSHDVFSWPSGTLCSVGDPNPASPIFPARGTTIGWRCISGTEETNCWARREHSPLPECGSLHERTFTVDDMGWPSDSFCSVGSASPSDPRFPEEGETTRWECILGDYSIPCLARKRIEVSPGYDIIRGYFVADGEINIKFVDEDKEVRDGLKVVGGLFATGNLDNEYPSIRLGRSLQLQDNLAYPTLIIFHDARYLDISRMLLGETLGGGYIREVGFKK